MAAHAIRRSWFGWRTGAAKAGAPAQTGYNTAKGNTVTINYDEPLRASPAATQFTAKVNAVARTVSGVVVSGSKVVITLAAPAVPGAAIVEVTYAKNGTPAQNLADAGGTAAPDFVKTLVAT